MGEPDKDGNGPFNCPPKNILPPFLIHPHDGEIRGGDAVRTDKKRPCNCVWSESLINGPFSSREVLILIFSQSSPMLRTIQTYSELFKPNWWAAWHPVNCFSTMNPVSSCWLAWFYKRRKLDIYRLTLIALQSCESWKCKLLIVWQRGCWCCSL